ncbi:hypothetical protein [Desulfobaculum bizertense]|uniref:Lipoprotein n=1 Tax=Desulfobaculum bizertense DSM 18034 TaxID=1121442 RepID=A0A1T4WWR5_9BACT|nr:hypothetical protein [Desulfobaculum bizertense]SKA81689.1 hypothetical protein SAMN02745702_02744 [Desulfobaculum bizertense DSM 18034]
MKNKTPFIYLLLCIFLSGCAAPLRVEDVSFQPPEAIPGHQELNGLIIAAVPVDSLNRSKELFHTDIKKAGVLPIHIIVQNNGDKELEINHQQIFGITSEGSYQVAFTLDNAAGKIRSSSIGSTAVAQTVAGAALGAAVGAGVGAGIGSAGGDAGLGAQSGAIIGGTTGAAAGLGAGVSDRWTLEFKKQLATHAFEDRVIYPGDIQQGFIYLRWQPYTKLRIKLFDITDNKHKALLFPISIHR